MFNPSFMRQVILSQAKLGKSPEECIEYLKALMRKFNDEFEITYVDEAIDKGRIAR